MKEKILNATIATMLIITLTMANFIVLGVNVVTYASELLHQTSETNYKNVEFTAYFKTESGDKIDMAQTLINTQDLKMYMQVAVKEEGYFLGEIEVTDSNFTLKQEKTSNAINKIEGNKITLNQINAGQTVELEVGITPINENSIDQGLLSAVTNVNLIGSYISSKEKETKIESTKNVQLLLQSPYTDNNDINLSSKIITNKLYKVSEEVIQQEDNTEETQDTTQNEIKEEAQDEEQNEIKEEAQDEEQNEIKEEAQDEEQNEIKEEAQDEEQGETKEESQDEVQNEEKEEQTQSTKTVEKTKRMIQVKAVSNLKENAYPIKETNLKFSIPEGTEKIEVSSQGTKATNGTTKIAWEKEDAENKLNVKIENTPSDENKIAWEKSGEDVVVVTFILPEEQNVTNEKISVEDEIILYDRSETKLSKSDEVQITETKDGTIEFSEIATESSIYKGKIYSNEDKQIKTNTNIYVNYEEQTENIKIQELNAKYVGDRDVSANVQYVKTVVNKNQIQKIFGEEGYIKITNAENQEIAIITKDTEANDNGNIEINYPEGTLSINIETSKPIAKGRVKLINFKTIKGSGYDRETIRKTNTLKQEIISTYADQKVTKEANIQLKETSTKASLSTNNKIISTQEPSDIELRAILKANKEEYDLYKNPTIKIQLPQEVTNVEVSNISLLYEDEMKIKTAKYDENTKTIVITLEGEQTKYHTDLNEGAQIYIAAKVKADELTPSKKSEIIFTYTNENAIEEQKQEKLPIKIESKYGLMLYSKILNYNNAEDTTKTIDSETAVAKIDLSKEEKVATMNLAVLNNYETTLTNLQVVGRIPNKEISEGTFDTNIAQLIKTNMENAKIYYSTNATADANDSTWVENVKDLKTIKSYKIVLDTIEPEQVLKFAYTFTIPANLGYNQVANGNFEVTYKYVEKEMSATSNVQLKTQEKKLVQYLENQTQERSIAQVLKEEKIADGLTVDTVVTTGGGENKATLKEGDSVFEGQTLHYTVTIKNDTGADLNNVKATVTQTNAKFYGTVTYKTDSELNRGTKIDTTYYKEIDDKEKIFTLKSIPNGESKIIEYEIVVNNVEAADEQTKGKIKFTSDNMEEKNIETISCKIKQGEVKLTIEPSTYEEGLYKIAGSNLPLLLTIENNSLQDLDDIVINIPNPNSKIAVFDPENIIEIEDVEETIDNFNDEDLDEDVDVTIPDVTIDEESKIPVEIQENKKELVKLKLKSTLGKGESKKLKICYSITREFENDEEELKAYYLIERGNDIYTSNVYSVVYKRNGNATEETRLICNQTGNPKDGAIVNEGETVIYTINLKNTAKTENSSSIYAQIPEAMIIEKIELGNEDITKEYIKEIVNDSEDDYETEEDKNYKEVEEIDEVNDDESKIEEIPEDEPVININNRIEKGVNIPGNGEINLKITAKLDTEGLKTNDKLTNEVFVTDNSALEEIEVNSITYYVGKVIEEENVTDSNNNSNNNNNNNNNNSSNNGNNTNVNDENNKNNKNSNETSDDKNTELNTYNIEGTIWIDKNRNGKNDDKTVKLENIQIKAINNNGEYVKNSQGDIINTQSSEDGQYNIELPEGEYMLIFEYDTGKYSLTTYTGKSNGSFAVEKTLTIDGKEKKVAVTNLITLNKNKSDINIGLIEKENFSLSLNKAISKVTTQNAGGTKIAQYKGTQLAKTEIRAKHFSGTNLIVEYKIEIKNNGDVDGYANDVVDYIPTGYKFSSDLNKTWYISTDGNLHNNSLANEKISVGKTKTLTLVLTKTLTENDTGLIVNTAEIANSASISGSTDVNSTVSNKANGEDDISSANLLISVSTGLKTACIIGVLISFILVGLCIYMIKRGEVE